MRLSCSFAISPVMPQLLLILMFCTSSLFAGLNRGDDLTETRKTVDYTTKRCREYVSLAVDGYILKIPENDKNRNTGLFTYDYDSQFIKECINKNKELENEFVRIKEFFETTNKLSINRSGFLYDFPEMIAEAGDLLKPPKDLRGVTRLKDWVDYYSKDDPTRSFMIYRSASFTGKTRVVFLTDDSEMQQWIAVTLEGVKKVGLTLEEYLNENSLYFSNGPMGMIAYRKRDKRLFFTDYIDKESDSNPIVSTKKEAFPKKDYLKDYIIPQNNQQQTRCTTCHSQGLRAFKIAFRDIFAAKIQDNAEFKVANYSPTYEQALNFFNHDKILLTKMESHKEWEQQLPLAKLGPSAISNVNSCKNCHRGPRLNSDAAISGFDISIPFWQTMSFITDYGKNSDNTLSLTPDTMTTVENGIMPHDKIRDINNHYWNLNVRVGLTIRDVIDSLTISDRININDVSLYNSIRNSEFYFTRLFNVASRGDIQSPTINGLTNDEKALIKNQTNVYNENLAEVRAEFTNEERMRLRNEYLESRLKVWLKENILK